MRCNGEPTYKDYPRIVRSVPKNMTNRKLSRLVEEIRGKIRELRTKPAFLRCLDPYVTKGELESIYQNTESLTRIFEEMSFFLFFQKRRDKPTAAGA